MSTSCLHGARCPADIAQGLAGRCEVALTIRSCLLFETECRASPLRRPDVLTVQPRYAVRGGARSGPLAPAEHRHAPAVGVDAVDVDPVRTDHPVDMDQALVATLRRDLLRCEAAAIDKAFRIALAGRDMAGGVLSAQ